ncbi:lectin-like domain-containing protein [Adhaeribacter pallidiroseus]|uniref:Serralysin n=1 Tax=Adhaeribacter pallidiroseus TaxID=2072847 RepID=A0A369QE30_9BACT|nr:cadherin domain-containing protein [Adhaeribacter pallidiroseus]RDC63171.1 Serralysin [Adhaeribacter pallidiroseus]
MAPNCVPTAIDVTGDNLYNTDPATTIRSLIGYETDGAIASYTITSLPNTNQGILYLANGTTAVTLNQVLNQAQASTLKFDPAAGFTGTALFTYTVTDNSGAFDASPATYSLTILINNPPVATDVTNATTLANTAAATAISALAATDADGTIASYTISTIPTAAQGILALGGTAVTAGQIITPAQATTLTFDPAATFTGIASFTFTAADNRGTTDDTPALYRIPVNAAPLASDVITSTANETITTNINALSATDTDGTIASFTIVSLPNAGTLLVNGIAATIGQVITPTQATQLSYTAPTINGNGAGQNNTFTYRATDNNSVISNTATYTIPVSNTDRGNNPTTLPPTATNITTAPLLNSLAATNIASLSATGGTITTYQILASSLPTAAQGVLYGGTMMPIMSFILTGGYYTLTAAQAASLQFDPAPGYFGTATFSYRASNNNGVTYSTNTATYSIPIDAAPAVSNTTTPPVANNATQKPITSLSATDADGTIVNFKIASLPTSGTLYINGVAVTAANLANTYSATANQLTGLTYQPNTTTATTVTFTFTTNDNDGYVSNTGTYSIPVQVNAAPDITSNGGNATAVVSFTENSTAVITTVIATNDNSATGGTTLTYSISGGDDQTKFIINSTTGALTFLSSPNFELPTDVGANNGYEVIVRVTDNGTGNLYDEQAITVNVINVNEAPTTPTDNNPAINTIAENATNGTTVGITAQATDPDAPTTLTYSLSDNAGGRFTINPTSGVVTVADGTLLNFENATSHNITVRVTDNGTPTAFTEQIFTIAVTDVNEPLVQVVNATLTVAEGATGLINNTLLEFTDPELATVTYTITTAVNNGTLFRDTDGDNIIDAGEDFALYSTFTQANINSGLIKYAHNGNEPSTTSFGFSVSDGTNTLINRTFNINVTPVNDPPTTPIDFNATANTIAENATAGTLVNITARSTDPDAGATITYAFAAGGNPGNRFAIDATTGVVTVATGAVINYETDQNFTITVFASDGTINSANQSFLINVLDVNEPPIFTTPAALSVAENNTAVTTLAATDPENNSITYTITGGADAGKFNLTSAGVLTFLTAPDFEGPTDVGNDNTYVVTVRATDTGTPAGFTDRTITLTVTNQNEAPVVTDYTNATLLNTAGPTGLGLPTVTDPENNFQSFRFPTIPNTATQGTLIVNGNPAVANQDYILATFPTITFTPLVSNTADVIFTFTLTDNGGLTSNTGTFTIPINGEPVAQNVTNAAILNTVANVSLNTGLAANDDGTIAKFRLTSLPTSGTLLYNGVALTTTGTEYDWVNRNLLTYTPAAGFSGNATFQYTVRDNEGALDASAATYTIPVTDNPRPVTIAVATVTMPSTNGPTDITDFSGTDTAPGSVAKYIIKSISGTAAQGTLLLNTTALTTGSEVLATDVANVRFDPVDGASGSYIFTFTAVDNQGAEDLTPENYTIAITNNVRPTTDDKNATVPSTADAVTIVPFTGADTSPGTVTKFVIKSITGTLAQGTLYLGTTALAVNSEVLLGDVNNLKFDPANGSSGTFSFTYTAVDNQNAEDLTPATYNIAIIADNAAVYSSPNTYNKDALALNSVLATVTDTDGALTSATLAAGFTLPAGTSLNALTGAVTVSNAANVVAGTYTFSVNTVDIKGGKSTVPVTITIVNDNAEAVYSTPNTFNKDALATGSTIATVSDADGALTSAIVAGTALPTWMSLDAVTGAITVNNGAAVVAGTYTTTINTVDNKGGRSTPTVSITIINDNAEAVYSTPNIFNKDALVTTSTLATVSDADGALTSAIVAGTALPTWMSLNATTGAITVNNAAAVVAGTYTTNVNTVDNKGGRSTPTVSITINNDIEAVYSSTATNTYNKDALALNSVLATVSDLDGAITSAVVSGTALPTWMSLNASTGTITVNNAASVVAGTYTTNVNTVDNKNGKSTVPVTIVINNDVEAVYSTTNIYSRFAITNGTPVATVSDTDGAITSATRTGTALPVFLTLNTNGTITVNSNPVADGTYATTVNTIDAKGGTSTNIPVSITINSDLYQPNNDAFKVADNCYQLTPDEGTKRGEVWRVTPINFANSFEVSFNAYLGDKDGGADGMAFGFQRTTNPLFASGQTGEGLGFGDGAARTGGIKPSVAIEFDTYQNTFTGSAAIEPAYDHISIFKNGDERDPVTTIQGTKAVQMSSTNVNVEDNVSHPVRIIWKKSTNTLYVYFNNVLRASYSEDFVNTVFGGNPTVYFGFTASTGGSTNRHEVCEITFTIMDEDGDGIADSEDLDDDNDGIPDILESGGFDPSGDDDNDGILNYKDPTFPNGNFNNTTGVNRLFDKDNDGIINAFDLDSDGDGITDVVEQAPNGLEPSSNYSSSSGRLTSPVGSNGIPSSSTTTTAASLNDFDGDGLYNFLDIDADNDGLRDYLEAQATPSPAVRTPSGIDTDKDGIDNTYDATCGCGSNGTPLYPVVSGVLNPRPDYLDENSDDDLYGDAIEAFDNNSDPSKVIGYSLLDLKDLADKFKAAATTAGNLTAAGYYDNTADSDSDGIPNWLEDADNDKRLNHVDFGSGFYHDSDNDGWIDLFDQDSYGTMPTVNYAFRSNATQIPLPAELILFAAKLQKDGTLLNWETASETNNAYYEVERSSDGVTFESIGRVKGAGTTSQLSRYTFLDKQPYNGTTYYRLKMVNVKGNYRHSGVIAVKRAFVSRPQLKAYPNPTTGEFSLDVTALVAEDVQITITDITGQVIQTKKIPASVGVNSVSLNITDLRTATYLIIVRGSNIYLVDRIVKF